MTNGNFKDTKRGGMYFKDGKPYLAVTEVLKTIDKPFTSILKYWYNIIWQKEKELTSSAVFVEKKDTAILKKLNEENTAQWDAETKIKVGENVWAEKNIGIGMAERCFSVDTSISRQLTIHLRILLKELQNTASLWKNTLVVILQQMKKFITSMESKQIIDWRISV